MLVTPSGMMTDVTRTRLKKAEFPILVTGYPPKVAGIVATPLAPECLVIVTSPFTTS
jgi:hypothetical protein